MLSLMKLTVLSLAILFNPIASFALEEKEITKFSEENSEMRRVQLMKMKELHIQHITDLYDLKLKHLAELDEIKKQIKPDNKEKNKELIKKFKEKSKTFLKEDKKFREDFREKVLKPMTKEYQKTMRTRGKQLKVKGRLKNSEPAKKK